MCCIRENFIRQARNCKCNFALQKYRIAHQGVTSAASQGLTSPAWNSAVTRDYRIKQNAKLFTLSRVETDFDAVMFVDYLAMTRKNC